MKPIILAGGGDSPMPEQQQMQQTLVEPPFVPPPEADHTAVYVTTIGVVLAAAVTGVCGLLAVKRRNKG